MNFRKKIIIAFVLVFSITTTWYLFIKESDYCITFKAKTATGTVFQIIQDWSSTKLKNDKETYSIVEKRNFNFIKQEMNNGKTEMEYTWEMTPINDTVTKIIVGIKDKKNSLYNRLTAPFFNTDFKKEQISKITDFKDGLEKHLANFKVKVDGEGKSEETFVAYINLKSVLQEKAQTMIRNNEVIVSYLYNNKIKIIGKPYVEVEKWDTDKELLEFNYCFPIAKNTKYVEDKDVKFKIIPAKKGLKATYYGNFRTSDRAWFALLDYAKKNNIKLDNKPLEHFMDNPFDGGDELKWKTEIIIPFSEKK